MRLPKTTTAIILFLTCTACWADHHEEGFYSLFDGKSLQGWDGNSKFWSVQDGAITGITTKDNPTKGNTFVIWRGGTVDNFELRLRFKIIGGNSGIQYRSQDKGNWVVGGYQADFESGDTYSGILYEERGRGILAQRGQVTRVVRNGDKHEPQVVATIGDTNDINKVIKKEDWNDYKIIADGNRMMHIINGRMTCQVIDEDATGAAKSGVLALQLHAGPPMKVQFKDIRIKPLSGVDISGKWDVEVETDSGSGSPSFEFDVKDGKLVGDYSGLFGEAIVAGKVNGKSVRWVVETTSDGNDIRAVYEGRISGLGKMKGKVVINDQLTGDWVARRAK